MSVTGPSISATFTYDGDGARVKSIINGTSTYFVGAHYELSGGVVTKYYYAGSSRVAMKTGSTVYYLLSDHLGSTSLTTNASGNVISELRYSAWGGVRYSSGSTPTDYTFTAQYSDSYINLLDYGSRRYDPEIGRFISPDSIVPLASQGVQAWDRFGYTNNNPVRYTDPTGHMIDNGGGSTCKNNNCSVTRTVLVVSHHWMPPYIPPGPDESDCAGCSAEGGIAPPGWVAIPGMVNGLFIWHRNNLSINGDPSIFTFITFEDYSDGTSTVDSITVHNRSNIELAISSVFIKAEQTTTCSTPSLLPSNDYYPITRVWLTDNNTPSPGVGIISEQDITTIPLSPSGNPRNPLNSWGPTYSISILIRMSQFLTGSYYRPTQYTIPQ